MKADGKARSEAVRDAIGRARKALREAQDAAPETIRRTLAKYDGELAHLQLNHPAIRGLQGA
jgi:hypothetical protein